MIFVAFGALGLILGSFVNALVWRLHEQLELSEAIAQAIRKPRARQRLGKLQDRMRRLSILRGRSMCPACGHELAAKDLVPLISWLTMRCRCRYCRKPISWQYPLVEAATAVLFAISYLWWPLPWSAIGVFSFCLWLVFVTMFMALAVYDLRWFLLPDRIVFPLIGLAAVEAILMATVFRGGWQSLLHGLWGVAVAAGLFCGLYIVSRGKWIGFGDVKLAIVLGLLVGGPLSAILLIFIASLIGSFIAVPLLLRGRATAMTPLPFGPFLLLATVAVVLFGGYITHWYTSLLLLP